MAASGVLDTAVPVVHSDESSSDVDDYSEYEALLGDEEEEEEAMPRPMHRLDSESGSLLEDGEDEETRARRAMIPKKRFFYIFPQGLESKLQWMDDPIIRLCQSVNSQWIVWASVIVTWMVAIEISMALPFVLFMLGEDGIAIEFCYFALMLCIVSQIPKRFIWRWRPWMVGRARKIKKTRTSSFPSRAVTCAVVYVFAVSYALAYERDDVEVDWWLVLMVIVVVGVASFARVHLGVHYPSDCLFGILQGGVICMLGSLLWKANILGCESCHTSHCYSDLGSEDEICIDNLSGISALSLAFGIGGSLALAAISIVQPIIFWRKSDRAYGLLLPCIAFQLAFLCPADLLKGSSLSQPPPPKWWMFPIAFAFPLFIVVLTQKTKGKCSFLMFCSVFLFLFSVLVLWRLFVLVPT